MDKKIKNLGIMNVIAACLTFAYIISVVVAYFTGAFNNDSENGSETAGYVILIIFLLPPILLTLSGLFVFSVYWLIAGVCLINSPVLEVKAKRLTIASLVLKIISFFFYVFDVFVLISSNKLLICILPLISALFIAFSLIKDALVLKEIKKQPQ